MTEDERNKLEYFRIHALPHLMEQLKFRGLILQVFLAGQAVLFNAWANSKNSLIAVIGFVACVTALLWDERARFVMGLVHQWGREFADKLFFPTDDHSNATDGVHFVFGKTLLHSGGYKPTFSQTFAIRLLIGAVMGAWIIVLCGHVKWAIQNWCAWNWF